MNIICNEVINYEKIIKDYNWLVRIYNKVNTFMTNYINKTNEFSSYIISLNNEFKDFLDKNKVKEFAIEEIYILSNKTMELFEEKRKAQLDFDKKIKEKIENSKECLLNNKNLIDSTKIEYINSKNQLVKKLNEVEKKKLNYFSKVKEVELLLINNKKKNENYINKQIEEMKKYESEYKKFFSEMQNVQKTFISNGQSSIDLIRNCLIQLMNSLKNLFKEFFHNYQKTLSIDFKKNEEILNNIFKSNLSEKLDKFVENEFERNKPLNNQELEYYNLDLLQQNKDNFHYIRNGNEENVFKIANLIYSNLSIKNPNYDLNVEKERVETIKCLDKILYYKSNETLSDEELDKLMLLLEKKSNKTILLSNLSEYRSKGKFEINEHSLQHLALIFNNFLNQVLYSNEYNIVQNLIILSETFFKKTDNNKIYLHNYIKNNPLFHSKDFWYNYIKFILKKEINDAQKRKIDVENTNVVVSNIVFGQLLTLTYNMIRLDGNKEEIIELLNLFIEEYKLSEDKKNMIFCIINTE